MKQQSWQKRLRWQAMTSRPPGPPPQKKVEQPTFTLGEKAACARKRRYPDEILARAMAAVQAKWKDEGKLYIYRCKVCSGWHLTKRPNGTPATSNDPFATEAA